MSETESTAAVAPIDRELRVASAAEHWAEQIADFGGRDTLHYFRDLKVGTLDLAAADPEPRKLLLDGEPVAVSRLFPHEPLRTSAIRSTRALVTKCRELSEERGLHTAHLAIGVATWADGRGQRRPGAPVLLREVTWVPRDSAESDFVLHAAVRPIINPMLLRAMAADLGIRLTADDLLDPAGDLRYVHVVERLREFAPPHVADGFAIAHRVVIGSFNIGKLVVLDELRHSARQMASHDVIAAFADDRLAEVALRESRRTPPGDAADVPLVLDADDEQVAAVADVLAGSHLVVHAPPGTGATQTITNMIAALVARGQRVLYVSQKRAAIDSTLERLGRIGLADLVLDLPGSSQVQATVAETVLLGLEQFSAAEQLSLDEVDDGDLSDLAAALQAHRDAAHSPRKPWDVSVYQAEAAVAATPKRACTQVRIPGTALDGLHGVALDAARAAMREYAELGGLTLSSTSPWRGARVGTREDARAVGDAVHHLLHNVLFACRDATTRASVEVGLPGPQTPAESQERVHLLTGIVETQRHLRPEVWQVPLDDYLAATGTGAFRRQLPQSPGWWRRRKLRHAARELLAGSSQRVSRHRLHELLTDASAQRDAWRRLARDSRRPRVGEHLPAAQASVAALREHLERLVAVLPDGGDLGRLPYHELSRRLVDLAGDEATLEKVPRLMFLHRRLVDAGLTDLVGDLRARGSDPFAAVAALDHAWYASLLERWHETDRQMEAFDSSTHDGLVAKYRAADRRRLIHTAARIRHSHQRGVSRLADDFPDQVALLRVETEKDGWHLQLRDLIQAAREVILGVKPCWMTSPLQVSKILPMERLFDVVIIDEASQLPWILAVPAIARGGRVVVFGDQRQLPPMPFNVAAVPDDVTETVVDGLNATANAAPLGSVLDRLAPLLPARALVNHYRSWDERLISFANRWFYDDRLRTLPAAAPEECIEHVLVTAQPGEGLVDSSTAEVDRVVDLVIRHARSRPFESLGVVCFTDKHAERVEQALRVALQRAPDVDDFFSPDRAERFFVKHLDQVQGDTRDAIILTLGYGRAADGRVLHRFGPLNHELGPRRLAAALTRARARMTVVSCFTGEELVPWRLNSDGAQALRDLLEFAGSHGRVKPLDVTGAHDAVRGAVADRLTAAGLAVEQMYGMSGIRVGLAVRHPQRPERFVLAVETDGPAYAEQAAVRDRERLRAEWLEHLGWRVHRVWGAAWAADAGREVDRIRTAYHEAVRAADNLDAAVAAVTADTIAGMPGGQVKRGSPTSRTPPALGTEGRATGAARANGRVEGTGGREAALPRQPIWAYSLSELVGVVQGLEAAGLRGEERLFTATLEDLRFQPGDLRVDAMIRQAVRVALLTAGGSATSTRGEPETEAVPGDDSRPDSGE